MKIDTLNTHIEELKYMKKSPKEIFYIGNTQLLDKQKISIVGTRKPSQYTKVMTHKLALALSNANIVVVSGAAMGVDAIAHHAAGKNNTIAVAGTGLDIRYPAVNKKLIEQIEQKGLMLSIFPEKTTPRPYNFPIRNELVAALGEVLVVAQADENSGTYRSIEHAFRMDKKVYALSHRIGESLLTQRLISQGLCEVITDIDNFVAQFSSNQTTYVQDEFLEFCKSSPTYDEAVQKDSQKLFEYELSGKIKVENGMVIIQ